MMKLLIKLAAILFLLRVLGGYAQAAPSPSLVLPTEKPEANLAEVYPDTSAKVVSAIQQAPTFTEAEAEIIEQVRG